MLLETIYFRGFEETQKATWELERTHVAFVFDKLTIWVAPEYSNQARTCLEEVGAQEFVNLIIEIEARDKGSVLIQVF